MIKGNNIHIRAIKEKDLEIFFEFISDIENQGIFLPSTMESEVQLKTQFSKNGFISEYSERYVITNKLDEIIGSIWAFKSVPYFDAIEVGFQIFDMKNCGKGYATESLLLFHNYIFEAKQVNRIELRIATENKASEKVAVKIGFTLEGTNREAAYSKGKLYDMNQYAMLRREWSENNAKK